MYVCFVLFNDELMRMMFLLNKTQSERQKNVMLKQEHNRIREENEMLKEVMRNPLCTNCGSRVAMSSGGCGGINFEIERLRLRMLN
ncbi:hypothetical protein Ddye_013653 [Dipteronia dyeriana]|uniref:Uncharacterized protein n=1 Tax=Dipteronia dyeriana TaxID=168575 RepID=A0AAD9X6T8_9ROSI|nr:hypothetical protein Ddye_013653 [Dipteronia dyeriana]